MKKVNNLVFCGALVLLSQIGCVSLPCGRSAREIPKLQSEIGLFSQFAYRRPARLVLVDSCTGGSTSYEVRSVTIRRAEPAVTPSAALELDYYCPLKREGTNGLPIVVILPISAGNYELETFLARRLVKNFAVVLAHRDEVPEEMKDNFTGEMVNALLRQSIIDARQVLDWIETRPELDVSRIGALGVSQGGIRLAILSAIDPRIQASVIVLAGGDLPYIIAHSRDGALHNRGITKRRNEHRTKHGCTLPEFVEEIRSEMTCDPLQLAPYVNRDKTLLILGRCDTVVPFRTGWLLRKHMGKPRTEVLGAGHYTAVLCLPKILRDAKRFLRENLSSTGTPVTLTPP